MAKLEDLVLLINSLTKAEKRHFNIFSSIQDGDKFYFKVYSLIEKGKTDRKELKEIFLQTYPKSSFEVCLRYLLKVILKSLRYSESQEQIDIYLLGQLLDIKQLYKKGIYGECLNQIKKFKELSLKHEKNFLFLEVSYLEMEYYTRMNLPQISENELILFQNTIKETIETELRINEHLTLYQLLLHRFTYKGVARNEVDLNRLNDLVLSEASLIGAASVNSFQSQQLHLLFQSLYFKVIGSPELSLEIYFDLDKLFQKNISLWERNPLYYVFLIEGILLNLFSLQEYNSIPFFIDRLKKIQQVNQDEIQIKSIIYQFELLFKIGSGTFKDATQLISENASFLKFLKTSDSINGAKIEYYQAIIYFGLKDWKNCIKSLNYILHEDEEFLKEYHNLARIIALLVHYEKEDYDYLEHEIRSFERTLKKQGSFYKFEKALFSMLINSIKAIDEKTKKEIYNNFKASIELLKDDKYEGRLISFFDFDSWLKSKITQTSFDLVVQNKYKK